MTDLTDPPAQDSGAGSTTTRTKSIRTATTSACAYPVCSRRIKLITVVAASCLLISFSLTTAIPIAKAQEQARVKHLYSAYDAILNSDSQMPIFLNHHHQKSPPESAGSDNRGSIKSKPTKAQSMAPSGLPQAFLNDDVKDPTILSSVKATKKKLVNSSYSNKSMSTWISGGRLEQGFSRVKDLFESVFGHEAYARISRPWTEHERKRSKDKAGGLVVPQKIDAKAMAAAVESMASALTTEQVEATEECVASAGASTMVGGNIVDDDAPIILPARKNSVIYINEQRYENEVDDEGDFILQVPFPSHHHHNQHNHQEDDIVTRFMHRHPDAELDDDLPCSGSQGSSSSGSVFQQTLFSFVLALSGFLALLIVVSYKMYTRRKDTSPLAFFHYLTLGIFTSPFKKASTLSNSTVSSYASLSSKTSRDEKISKDTDVDNAASTSIAKARPVVSDLRRTSASQYHLQQQVHSAKYTYQSSLL